VADAIRPRTFRLVARVLAVPATPCAPRCRGLSPHLAHRARVLPVRSIGEPASRARGTKSRPGPGFRVSASAPQHCLERRNHRNAARRITLSPVPVSCGRAELLLPQKVKFFVIFWPELPYECTESENSFSCERRVGFGSKINQAPVSAKTPFN